ncbi:MAG: chitin binding domain-containing protein, partial [Culturomica sp.]|nr:chitin binding domain-containing protein [Culturomica sp.]
INWFLTAIVSLILFCSMDRLVPNPADCTSYYVLIPVADNGTVVKVVPILLPCPDGLHFNYLLDVCDWPQNCPTCKEREEQSNPEDSVVEPEKIIV